jgi:serine/threonine protein kinase
MPDEPPPNPPPPEAPTQAEGQRFFRHYVLVRPLGRGPLGASWLVMHEGIGRQMALRFLPEGWVREEKIIAALQAAVRQSLEITHRGIVSVQDFVNDGTTAAIITKYVDADTLHEVKARHSARHFSLAEVQPWLVQTAEALDFAWAQHGAVHGDVNPHNLLITQAGEVRVSDFGLARSLFDITGPDGAPLLVGTLAYISPERARGAPVSAADDVYGFGATVYELLTGRPPFFRGNILWQLSSVVPPAMHERRAEFGLTGEPIPAEWEEIIAACLAKRLEDRPRHIREVGERLGLLPPLPPSAEQAAPPPVLPKTAPVEPPKPFIPPPPPKDAPVIEYPSSLATAAMLDGGELEPVTMAGPALAALRAAETAPPAKPGPAPAAAAPEPPPAKVEISPPAPPVPTVRTADTQPASSSADPPPLPPAAVQEKTAPPPSPAPVQVETKPPPPPMPAKKEIAPPPPRSAAPPPAAPPPVAPSAPPPVAPPSLPGASPAGKKSLSLPVLLGGGAAAVLALGLGFLASRSGKQQSAGDASEPASTPTPAPLAVATPRPTPVPPQATPGPVRVSTVDVRGLAALAGQPLAERKVLVGNFRVVSAQPPREAHQRCDAVLRPVDPAFSGKVRVLASFPPGTRLAEGSTLAWSEASDAVLRKVDPVSDGVNVQVQVGR